ncbi:hypothetical protein BVY03_02910 [bacterium K02(2017)]|nr:hypothetical protein BVY03_02910 [bacterium K02(2017)]
MWNWPQKIIDLQNKPDAFVLVTVIEDKGSTPRDAGAKMIVLENNESFGTIGGGNLEELAKVEALKILRDGKNQSKDYSLCQKTSQCCGGKLELLFEILNLRPKLYLFGAGHVGQAVCQVLADTMFDVHLIDDRPKYLDMNSIPSTVKKYNLNCDDFISKINFCDKNTFVVVMTYLHSLDQKILERMIKHPLKFIGLLGIRPNRPKIRQN